MWSFGALCDEFYVTTRLFLKLDLDPSRETMLHFLEQIRRGYPRMSRLRRRDDGSLVLDEESGETDERRYVRVDPDALKLGFYDPPSRVAVEKFSELVLTQAPPHLSLSELDFDHMEVSFGFDLEYRGNHDELIAETLFADHPLLSLFNGEKQRIIDCQPFWGVTLTDSCDTQAYLEMKGRTTTYEVRSGEYEPTPLSVYLTVRKYWGYGAGSDLPAIHKKLVRAGETLCSERIVPHVIKPLAAAIASRR